MALNRHFPGHFARFVNGFSAISQGGLSLGEIDPRSARGDVRISRCANPRPELGTKGYASLGLPQALTAASGRLAGMLTWYDVLGVLPGASPGQVQSAYQERARLLDPRMLNGASSKVLKAADTARATVDEAWRILQDAAARRRYDEKIGAGRGGAGLDSAPSIPSGPGGAPGRGVTADMVMAGLADLMTPHPSPARRIIVPDLRGLFARSCLRVTGDLGLHVEMVQLTKHPMPVEGLVVDQSPPPGTKVRRSSTLTVEIWHPPSRG